MVQTKKQQLRSLEENAYYWGVVIAEITRFQKWQPEKAHAWIKLTWNVESTTGLTTTEFEELMENVRQHVKTYWDLVIPLPNE